MALAIRLEDITHIHCDAIVTATDTALSGTCGVDQDIHRAAGPELDAACRALAPCPVASAVCTDGYRLSRKIIHAVGPAWHGDSDDLQTLAACYRAVFACAREARCVSLAMPLISAFRRTMSCASPCRRRAHLASAARSTSSSLRTVRAPSTSACGCLRAV